MLIRAMWLLQFAGVLDRTTPRGRRVFRFPAPGRVPGATQLASMSPPPHAARRARVEPAQTRARSGEALAAERHVTCRRTSHTVSTDIPRVRGRAPVNRRP